jgi:hypothetical protein
MQRIRQQPPTMLGRFCKLLGRDVPPPELPELDPDFKDAEVVEAASMETFSTLPFNSASWTPWTAETKTRTTSMAVNIISLFIISS